MALQDLYLAKQELKALLQDEEGFVGIGICRESEEVSNLALKVLVHSIDSPVIAKIPRYHGLYRVKYDVVGDIQIQELGIDEGDEVEGNE